MALSQEDLDKLVVGVTETALAINDRINATNASQRLAAQNRYINGWRDVLRVVLNLSRHGTQGDY